MTVPSVYVGAGRVLTLTPWGAKILTRADDLSLMPDVALTGEYDPPFLRFLERTIEPGDVVVDVGANVGLFTLRMAWLTGPRGRVFAFEPNPAVRSLLEDNVALNYVTWVRVSDVAAADAAGRRRLHVTTRFQGNSSLVSKNAWYERHFLVDRVESCDVEVGRLDDLLPDDVRFRLIKIDVEGAEPDVLAGLERILAEGRCAQLDVEVSKPLGERQFDELVARIRRLVDGGAGLAELGADGALLPIELDEVVRREHLAHLIVSLP